MPYKQEYNRKTVGTAKSGPVLGSQGTSASIPVSFNKSKSTKVTDFSNMFKSKKGPAKLNNHA